MRFLAVLLLSICCIAANLQSSSAAITVTQPVARNEYRVAETAYPDDALNDYHHIVAYRHTVSGSSLQKETVVFSVASTRNFIPAYAIRDSFQNSFLLFSGTYAKIFKAKLLFPKHYYW